MRAHHLFYLAAVTGLSVALATLQRWEPEAAASLDPDDFLLNAVLSANLIGSQAARNEQAPPGIDSVVR